MKVNKRILYTKLAEYYDYLAPSTTTKECEFLDEVFKEFGGERISSILDLGCGTGRHASLLQKRGYKVTGIDLSTQMLKIARERVPDSTFIKMDFCSPKFDRNSFDASICMWSTIGYILNKEKFKDFIKNVSGVTREILVLSSTNHQVNNFQPNESTEKTLKIPDGQIMTKITRRYDDKTGIREEVYEYSITEKDKTFNVVDKNKLRLWKVEEIEKLLLPEFRILKIYGSYSINDNFNKQSSEKKIIVARKVS